MKRAGGKRTDAKGEAGQASIYLILVLATFLLTGMAFSVDLTNMWFHRQQAQTAADAACQAGALDMLAVANGVTPPHMNFAANVGASGSDCASGDSPNATMCRYAAFNGFDGSGGFQAAAASKSVAWTFPASVNGAATPSTGAAAPYLNVVAAENVKTWFMNLVGVPYVKTSASCTCGMSGGLGVAGPPVVVLNPDVMGALSISGGAVIKITGGSQISVQVNSSYTEKIDAKNRGACGPTNQSSVCNSAVSCSGSGQIDTSTAGPNGTGGNVDITGGPSFVPYCGSTPAQVPGTTGLWQGGVAAISDPYAWLQPPDKPTPDYNLAPATKPLWVPYKVDGCPANASMGQYLQKDTVDPRTDSSMTAAGKFASCLEFFPGYYPHGINLTQGEFDTRGVGAEYSIAIFAPGTYYLNDDFVVTNGATVRNAWPHGVSSPSSATPNQTGGVTFYFSKGGPSFAGNTDANNSKIDPVPMSFLSCSPTSPLPSGSVNGAVLLGPCTTRGGYWQAGGAHTDTLSSSVSRGLVMYGSPDNELKASFGASGSLTFVGSLYFSASKTNADVLTMDGAAGTNTLVVGQIVADQIHLSGSGKIIMNVMPGSSSANHLQMGVFR